MEWLGWKRKPPSIPDEAHVCEQQTRDRIQIRRYIANRVFGMTTGALMMDELLFAPVTTMLVSGDEGS